MSEPSATRRELEQSIRELIPTSRSPQSPLATQKSTTAAVGVGGLFTGYVWGWLRGRRSRKKKRR
ncbi:MAG: hypothetical protein HIU84_03555 [Acidobacteria bacterium]|nr:hypothetical protein [Acidobacteriota bacterium]